MRKAFLIIVLTAAVLTIPGLADREFYTRGEPREALVMQAMVNGEWILPRGYSGVIPSKPPLMHWIGAALSLPQGVVTEGTSRLPSALASICFAVFFFLFLRKRVGAEEALLAPLIMLTSIEWYRSATNCRVDMIFSVCFAAGLLMLYSWRASRGLWSFVFAVVLLTGATLGKGPVSIVLPGAIFTCWLFLLQGGEIKRKIGILTAVFLPVMLLALVWYYAAWRKEPALFFDKVWEENFGRFLGTADEDGHHHSPFYLLGMLAAGFLPWSLLLLPCVRQLAKVRLTPAIAFFRSGSIYAFSALTSILVVVFFLIPASKRGVYLLPAYPFISLLAAAAMVRFSAVRLTARVCASVCALLLVLAALAGVGMVANLLPPWTFVKGESARSYLGFAFLRAFSIPDLTWAIAAVLVILTLVSAWAVLVRGGARHAVSLRFWILLLASIGASVLPIAANGLSSKPFAEQLAAKIGEHETLCSFDTDFYGLSFYLRRQIYFFAPEARCSLVLMNATPAVMADFKRNYPDIVLYELARSAYGITKPETPVVLYRAGAS